MTKETGIIMSGNHPRLILDNLKSQTRRTYGLEEINKCPDEWSVIEQPEHWSFYKHNEPDAEGHFIPINIKCHYGGVGDLLWCKEAFSYVEAKGEPCDFGVLYYADGEILWWRDNAGRMNYPIDTKKRPSIFMPRWASRIQKPISSLRPERLWDMTEEDAIAEGCVSTWHLPGGNTTARYHFYELWDSLNAKRGYPWSMNPWCWCIKFSILYECQPLTAKAASLSLPNPEG